MIEKLLEMWTTFGLKVTYGYSVFEENIGMAVIIVMPLYLLGFVIPWFMTTMVLVGIDILYGRIVYGVSFKEQWDCFKEGLNEGLNEN